MTYATGHRPQRQHHAGGPRPQGDRTTTPSGLRCLALGTLAMAVTACGDALLTGYEPERIAAPSASVASATSNGWNEGDLIPDVSAYDVNGVEVSLGDFAGQFVLVEVGGVWCLPSQLVAPWLPSIEQTLTGEGIPFTTVVSLVESSNFGQVSDAAIASAWLTHFYGGAYRSVLHMNGSTTVAAPWYQPISQHSAIPILFLLAPNGKIVQLSVGTPSSEAALLVWIRDGMALHFGPRLESVNGPEGPVSNALPLVIDGTFSDPDGDTRGGSVDWGDGSAPEPLIVDPAGAFRTPPHTYTEPGFYDIRLELIDDAGNSSEEVLPGVTIFDPDGGFIVGAGSVLAPGLFCDSLECDPDPAAPDRPARFRLLAKYMKKASVPDGAFDFQFESGSFRFEATAYDWLLVNRNDSNAQLKGEGTVNGETPEAWGLAPGGTFRFMLRANDGPTDSFLLDVWLDHPDTGDWSVYSTNGSLPLQKGNILLQTRR
jgi:hypothetical protein